MPVSVIMPERRKAERDTLLDDIAQGLNIAASAYGIYDKAAQKEIEKQKLAIDQQKLGQQAKSAQENVDAELVSKGLKRTDKGFIEDPESSIVKSRYAAIERDKAELEIKKAANDLKKQELGVLKNQTAFKSLPEDQKILVEKFVGTKAKLFPIVNQFDQYIAQMKDPKLTDNDKLQLANQSVKIMNSMDPDAVGKEEVERIAGFLTVPPQPWGPKGWKFGVDLDGYTKALENTRNRINGTFQAVTNQIETVMGRSQPLPMQVPAPAQPAKQSASRGVLENRANAAPMPDFSTMSIEQLNKYLGK